VAQRDALLRLHKSLLARRTELRNTLAGELEHFRGFRTNQTGDSADSASSAATPNAGPLCITSLSLGHEGTAPAATLGGR
jgi:hypothetical protein